MVKATTKTFRQFCKPCNSEQDFYANGTKRCVECKRKLNAEKHPSAQVYQPADNLKLLGMTKNQYDNCTEPGFERLYLSSVYRLTHRATGHTYIGQTEQATDNRVHRHFAAAQELKKDGSGEYVYDHSMATFIRGRIADVGLQAAKEEWSTSIINEKVFNLEPGDKDRVKQVLLQLEGSYLDGELQHPLNLNEQASAVELFTVPQLSGTQSPDTETPLDDFGRFEAQSKAVIAAYQKRLGQYVKTT
ncbi:hypothetical protein NX722_21855 [Endozoicomonas gorgoniicola]|uniref:GIY-YIG domain-containing protein n=1 Tax=Endozoicomonas gorgoniicola TaxID=1234144 RepID=A0ABT3N0Q9_9GAMM|nr:hypothetical protein [Endozoicomonas gorgoniicola]MCW7555220.1 hypothetical protein [Endozoicomonas gorgoniicola]